MSFEAVIESFSESVLISEEANDTNRCHPKYSQWKRQSVDQLQEKRRKEFFDNQKKNRKQIVMRFRSLLNELEFEDNSEAMDTTIAPKLKLKSKPKSQPFYVNKYKNQLMLSEWLVETPELLATDWYLVLCPIGKRCLVMASRGETKAYSRTGYLMNTFGSLLPGGNRRTSKDSKQNCIIDCIFSETERVYYVLDVMSWNGLHCYECETEFRFYWLDSKLETEYSEVSQRSHSNPYPFVGLKRFGCTEPAIVSALRKPLQFAAELDGLLFYHKGCHYTPGVSPLVNWLKPNMVSDILNIDITNITSNP